MKNRFSAHWRLTSSSHPIMDLGCGPSAALSKHYSWWLPLLFESSLCCWLLECVDAVNLASSLALTEGMLGAHLLPFTLFTALQIKTTFTHTPPPLSLYCTAHLATHIASSAHCRVASGPSEPNCPYSPIFWLLFCVLWHFACVKSSSSCKLLLSLSCHPINLSNLFLCAQTFSCTIQ